MGLFGGRKKAKGKSRREPSLFDRGKPEAKAAPAKKSLKRRFFGWLMRLVWAVSLWGAVATAVVLGFVWFTLAQKDLFKIPEREPGILILASDGSEIAEQGTFFGDAVSITDLPPYVPQAIIAIEDRRFHSHYGIDPIGLSRAMLRNAMAGRLREGGSTLTQQLAKNLFLSHERTVARKLQEAIFAIWLEREFTKDEILQLYLNRVYFGGGADGIDKASRSFYGKSAYELSLMEAATLAGVLKAPTTYNPAKRPEEALGRAKLVLDAMVREGYITEDEAKDAIASPAKARPKGDLPATQYAVDWISGQLPLFVKSNKESLIIETTIDPKLQATAEKSLRKRLSENGKKLNVSQGAVLTLDRTGAVKALVGGRNYQKSQFNRATTAKRQPGSAFKAFVYLAAIENGYRPDSVEMDEPVKFGNWSPENHKQKYRGAVTLQQSYALSLNSVAAKLTQAVSPKSVTQVAKRLGVTSPLGNDVSIALGTSEVTLMELTSAYAPFGNGGLSVEPYVVRRILSRDGKVLYERLGDGLAQVVGEQELYHMNSMMRSVVSQGTATKARFPNMDMGGKTGTSQDYRDAWFVGYTPYYTTGVWMGNDDNTPTKNVTGGTLPAQVWRDVMQPAHQGLKPRLLPGDSAASEVVVAEVDTNEEAKSDVEENTEVQPKQRKKRGLLSLIFGDDEVPTQEADSLY
jgi:penicillin-binding protein 1A